MVTSPRSCRDAPIFIEFRELRKVSRQGSTTRTNAGIRWNVQYGYKSSDTLAETELRNSRAKRKIWAEAIERKLRDEMAGTLG